MIPQGHVGGLQVSELMVEGTHEPTRGSKRTEAGEGVGF